MFFHATHKHNYQTCPAHNADVKAQFMGALQSAEEKGVKVHGMYTDVPGHTIFMVLESDSVEKLVAFFDPIVDLGDTDIRPVTAPINAIAILQDN